MPQRHEQQRFRHLHKVRRRLSDGTSKIHFYHRPTKTRLPAPDHPDFSAAYQAAEAKLPRSERTPGPTADVTPSVVLSEKPQELLASAFELLTPDEVILRYRNEISLGTLKNWRAMKIGPAFIKIRKAVFYPLTLLEQWEKANTELCDAPVTTDGTERDRQPV